MDTSLQKATLPARPSPLCRQARPPEHRPVRQILDNGRGLTRSLCTGSPFGPSRRTRALVVCAVAPPPQLQGVRCRPVQRRGRNSPKQHAHGGVGAAVGQLRCLHHAVVQRRVVGLPGPGPCQGQRPQQRRQREPQAVDELREQRGGEAVLEQRHEVPVLSRIKVEGGSLQELQQLLQRPICQKLVDHCVARRCETLLERLQHDRLGTDGLLGNLLAHGINVDGLVVGLLPQGPIVILLLEVDFEHLIGLVHVLRSGRMVDATVKLLDLRLHLTLLLQPSDHLGIMSQFPQRREEISGPPAWLACLQEVAFQAAHRRDRAIGLQLRATFQLDATPGAPRRALTRSSLRRTAARRRPCLSEQRQRNQAEQQASVGRAGH
mmetsp:Transcript_61082/g.199754  ORF Transcript_61082/g.199754 Transcript_61082/m.199754 type:complete len:378 (+) Transcript_61082:263-1396(+)